MKLRRFHRKMIIYYILSFLLWIFIRIDKSKIKIFFSSIFSSSEYTLFRDGKIYSFPKSQVPSKIDYIFDKSEKKEIEYIHNFLMYCNEGKLLYPIENKNYNNPEISIYFPTYNKEKYILRLLRTIQNQTFKNLEMIFIDDGSTDNSVQIIEKYQKEDSRIKLFRNDKNRGTVFSRAMGILRSKGKYLITFDCDDMPASPDILEVLYNTAVKNNVDVVEYGVLVGKKLGEYNKYYPKKRENLDIVKQPELSYRGFFDYLTFDITNKLFWDKFIKKEVCNKLVQKMEKYIYGDKWVYFDDTVLSFVTLRTAQSYIYIGKYGIFHYRNDESLWGGSSPERGELMTKNCFISINAYFEMTDDNSKDKKIAVEEFRKCFGWRGDKEIMKNKIKKEIINIGETLLNSNYVTHADKIGISKLLKGKLDWIPTKNYTNLLY